MKLLLLLFIVIINYIYKYNYQREGWPCNTSANARRTRDNAKNKFDDMQKGQVRGRETIEDYSDEVNNNTVKLMDQLVVERANYDKILKENESLVDTYNKLNINDNICNRFNNLKLLAIKKIYS